MFDLLARLRDGGEGCGCETAVEDGTLVVDADDCEAGGRLTESAPCRATVVGALRTRDVERVHTRRNGLVRAYEGDAAALLVAAGRFADAVRRHDERLAERTLTDPLGAAREATGRSGSVARLAAETALAEGAARYQGYDDALRPYVGPTISRSRVATRPPPDATLVATRTLDTDARVRVYDREHSDVRTYHVEPVEHRLDRTETATLAEAYRRLASGAVDGGERAPYRAVESIASDSEAVDRLGRVLEKHTRSYGVLSDLFADPDLSDAFVTAPVSANPIRVRVDGETMRTNVRLSPEGAAALASRFRRESGAAFSQASPTLDASVTTGQRRIRVAGVTDPASDGVGFAFRACDREAWTLPALVANETLSPRAGAVLSVAVERGVAGLVAGPRGAGKTTLLGALLWELPPAMRAIVVEDTPELPVDSLQSHRDVQRLVADDDGTGPTPTETVRTALRLGSGALVVGEIRGEEAGALYEAMRVGANDGAVLGTIHGDGGDDVRERVVTDLGVPESSFGVTDLLVTVEAAETADGTERRVRRIEEVHGDHGEVTFTSLFERGKAGLTSTDRIERGNSRLVAALTDPGEEYAAIRNAIDARETWLSSLVGAGHTDPATLERERATRPDGRDSSGAAVPAPGEQS